jgi:hypothetical protein
MYVFAVTVNTDRSAHTDFVVLVMVFNLRIVPGFIFVRALVNF